MAAVIFFVLKIISVLFFVIFAENNVRSCYIPANNFRLHLIETNGNHLKTFLTDAFEI